MKIRIVLAGVIFLTILTVLGLYLWDHRIRLIQRVGVYDVYIEAGHEGRESGNTGAESPYGREIDWTPVVANEATRVLREAGFSVLRVGADHRLPSFVKLAISIHFDGSERKCASGASIGYNAPSDLPAASVWKALYKQHFPYQWMPDNFTDNLRYYYSFFYTIASDSELVLELGEITCKEQAKWLKSRLRELGILVTQFALSRLDGTDKMSLAANESSMPPI